MKQSIKQIIKSVLVCGMALSLQVSFAQGQLENKNYNSEKLAKAKNHTKIKHLKKDELHKVKAEIRAIKDNINLTEEEKQVQIKALRQEFKIDRKLSKEERLAIRKNRQNSKENKLAQTEKNFESGKLRKIKKQKLKAEIRAIKDNVNLSKDEKKNQIDKLNSSYKAQNEKNRHEAKVRNQRILKTKQIEKATINPERAKKALKQLEKSESQFNKLYKKGKITEALYTDKIKTIHNLRAKLSDQ